MGITADKIADLVSTVSAEPSQWTTLTPAERLTVALILDKIDWLRADGYESVSAARNRLGPEWWQAMQEVKARRATMATKMRQSETIDISALRWARWRRAATKLGNDGLELAGELKDAQRNANRQGVAKCIKAARDIERHTTGEAQLIANAIATELEDAAG